MSLFFSLHKASNLLYFKLLKIKFFYIIIMKFLSLYGNKILLSYLSLLLNEDNLRLNSNLFYGFDEKINPCCQVFKFTKDKVDG